MKIVSTVIDELRNRKPDDNNDAWVQDKNREIIMEKLCASGLISPKDGSTPYQSPLASYAGLYSDTETTFEHLLEELYDGIESGQYAESEKAAGLGLNGINTEDEGKGKKYSPEYDEFHKAIVIGSATNPESLDKQLKNMIINALENSRKFGPVLADEALARVKAHEHSEKGNPTESLDVNTNQVSNKFDEAEEAPDFDLKNEVGKEKNASDDVVEINVEVQDVELNLFSSVLSQSLTAIRTESVESKVDRAKEVGLLVDRLVDRFLISENSIRNGGKLLFTLDKSVLDGAEILLEKQGATIHVSITAQTEDSYRYLYRRRHEISAHLEDKIGDPVLLSVAQREC